MTALRTRAATNADAEAMQEIYRAASLSNDGDRAELLARPELLILEPELASSGRTVVVTADSVGPVAFASHRPISDDVTELDDLFTHPQWRRQGAARLLIAAIVDDARTHGIRRIEVTANVHAMAFYDDVGFRGIGTADTQLRQAPRMALCIGTPASLHPATPDPGARP
jgi:GNAT superfamily N-acetyltransferase